jgi:D-glycero-alpha-D-manno-heptose-7-phosphate kinase
MIDKWTDLSTFLTLDHVYSSTPTRLDCGGSTDHRLTGLLCRSWQPVTANIAIDLRAHVCLKPYKTGRIFVDINGLGKQEFTVPHLPLVGPFALISALVCYFGVHGFHLEIRTEFPFQSGLGGSGAVTIALIGAMQAALRNEAPQTRDFPGIVQFAHNLEDSLFRNTGMQDQAAAVYGGANLWKWQYAHRLNFRRQQLVSDVSSLNGHILLAYTGRPHLQSQNGSHMLEKFKETGALSLFVSISEQARKFAESLKRREFGLAGECLATEHQLRSILFPVTRQDDLELIEMAMNTRCGVSVTGNGGGGCIWAIGEKQDIADLKRQWNGSFELRKVGHLLPVSATGEGLRVSIERASKTNGAVRRRGYE